MTPTRGSVRLLQATTFVSTVDRFAMPPMLVAMSGALDVPLASLVHTAGVYFLAYGLMQPVWGVISDRLGRVRTLRLSLLLAALASGASALSTNLTQLGVTRALAGAFFAAAVPASLIYVGDTVPGERRQTEVTNLMTGVALGTALASAGAGALAQAAGWRFAFAVSATLALVLVVLLRRLPEPVHERPSEPVLAPAGRVVRSGSTLVLLALVFVEGAVLLGALTLLPAAVERTGAGATLAGAVTAAYGIAVLVCARLVGWMSRRWPAWWLIAAGAVATLAGCTLAAVSQAAAPAAVVAVLIGFGWAAMHSTLQTWATQVLPSARATVVSLFAGSLFAGSAAASALAAGPAGTGRFGVVFAGFAALTVPLGVLAAVARARWREPALVRNY
ncbi:MAG TPA: MFS transporter [Actinoplanes sp.]|nr:MFS transporter [Actinoplanes sp.]